MTLVEIALGLGVYKSILELHNAPIFRTLSQANRANFPVIWNRAGVGQPPMIFSTWLAEVDWLPFNVITPRFFRIAMRFAHNQV